MCVCVCVCVCARAARACVSRSARVCVCARPSVGVRMHDTSRVLVSQIPMSFKCSL